MMTVHKLSAGDGYTYYTREVASGDELRAPDRKLGDYYTVSGNPPGMWGGRGAALLGVSGEVTEPQMELLYGQGLHPLAGQVDPTTGAVVPANLGQRFKRTMQSDDVLGARINEAMGDFTRLQKRDPDVDERRKIRTKVGGEYFRELHGRNPSSKEELGQFLTRSMKPASNAVAGFDLVFSPPKSVSFLWGVSTKEARRAIEKAQHDAVSDTMNFLEENATYTRKGRNGVRTEGVQGGLTYTSFRHFDSRTGDPQLHDHVVVSNKVKGLDGNWGTLDGRHLYKFGVSASEHYNRRVIENVCNALGLAPMEREVPGKQSIIEIGGVPMAAIEAASSRRADINKQLETLKTRFVAEHGYEPNKKQLIALSQQATLATRPDKKEGASLSELVDGWKEKFAGVQGVPVGDQALAQARGYAATHLDAARQGTFTLDDEGIQDTARRVIREVSTERSTWSRHHVEAASRRLLGAQAGAHRIPAELISTVVARSLEVESLSLSPGIVAPAPVAGAVENVGVYQRPDATLYTSAAVLTAENNLVEAASTSVVPAVSGQVFDGVLLKHRGPLDAGQEALARAFATEGKLLVGGLGPAGAGKTTAMKLAVDAFKKSGSRVFALAPTAAAAKVLADEVGADSPFTVTGAAYHAHLPELQAGDVLLIDEAGMLETGALDTLVSKAAEAGSYVRILGDDRQLGAVGAGGALRLINNEVGLVRLQDVHRFRNQDGTPNTEEAAASLAMREPATSGADKPFEYYSKNHRLVSGDVQVMADEVFAAWQKDSNAGLTSLMLAPNGQLVAGLNERAQSYRIAAGELNPQRFQSIRDNAHAHVGDIIVTRKNSRVLQVNRGKDFVKNSDTWEVIGLESGGRLRVKNTEHGGKITLPAWYVAEHAELGYASTIHRAQGRTVDTAHALLTATTDRAGAYVATSRGKYENRVYVGLQENQRPAEVLETIANNYDLSLPAHEQIDRSREEARELATMGEIYRDVCDMAHDERVKNTIRGVLGPDGHTVVTADAFGALRTHMDQAQAAGLDPVVLLRNAYEKREIASSDDPAAVLDWRMEALASNYRSQLASAGQRPLANMPEEHLRALQARASAHLAETMATPTALVEAEAVEAGVKPYTHRLFGHLTDTSLEARIEYAQDQQARQIPSDPENKSAQLGWEITRLQDEAQLRQDMPAPLHEAETLMREQPMRHGGAQTVLGRINTELELRAIAAPPAPELPANGQQRMGEWFAPTAELTHPDMPEAWVTQLDGYRARVATEHERVGSNLAANPPAWADALGPVPTRPDKAEDWRVLAAEIQAYRHSYNIPDSESALAPKNHQDRPTVQDFTARATSLHKHSALTTQPGASEENRQGKANRAEDAARPNIEPTQAETFVGQLRREHIADATPVDAPATQQAETAKRTELQEAIARFKPKNTLRPFQPKKTDPAKDQNPAERFAPEPETGRSNQPERGPERGL